MESPIHGDRDIHPPVVFGQFLCRLDGGGLQEWWRHNTNAEIHTVRKAVWSWAPQLHHHLIDVARLHSADLAPVDVDR
jgi:hypothetical protein